VQTITDLAAPSHKAQEARRFAELAARTGLEPDLAQRYANDPVAVLAEFGLSAAEPVYAGEFLTTTSAVLIEELDSPGTEVLGALLTFCTGSEPVVAR
jgi:hypothetical protein